MKTHKILAALAAVAILALTATSPAQRQGGGGAGGGQRGQGRGMFGRGQMSSVMLLQRKDVQEDLKLTDDQKSKLSELQDSMREMMMQRFQGNGGERPSREEMQKMMAEVMTELQKKVDAILTPEQSKRLKEIDVQMAGNSVVMRPEVAKAIALTDAQQTKIKALQDGMQKAQTDLFEKMRNGELDREALQEKMKNNQTILNTEIDKILTAEQKAKLKTMGGAPFKREDDVN